jgi:hypothetical protein
LDSLATLLAKLKWSLGLPARNAPAPPLFSYYLQALFSRSHFGIADV